MHHAREGQALALRGPDGGLIYNVREGQALALRANNVIKRDRTGLSILRF